MSYKIPKNTNICPKCKGEGCRYCGYYGYKYILTDKQKKLVWNYGDKL